MRSKRPRLFRHIIAFAVLVLLCGCFITSERDISSEVDQVYPIPTGYYIMQNEPPLSNTKDDIFEVVRTADGYEYLSFADLINEQVTLHIYKIPEYDGYILQAPDKPGSYLYTYVNKTPAGWQILDVSKRGEEQIAASNYLGQLITKNEMDDFGITLSTSSINTLEVLKEIARRKIDLTPGLGSVIPYSGSGSLTNLLATNLRRDCTNDDPDPIRNAFCRVPALADKHVAMSIAYGELAGTLPVQKLRSLRIDQDAWARKTSLCAGEGDVAGCLMDAYDERNKQLNMSQRVPPLALPSVGNAQTSLYHLPQTPAERALDNIFSIDTTGVINYAPNNPNIGWLIGINSLPPQYAALFTRALILAVTNAETAEAQSCVGLSPPLPECTLDHDPLVCASDIPPAPILYRTISDNGSTAIVAYEWGTEGKDSATYRLVDTNGVWQLDGVHCIFSPPWHRRPV